MAEVMLRVIMPNWQEYYGGRFIEQGVVPGFHPVAIGRANFDDYFSQNNGDFRTRIRINSFNLRNDEPVEKANDAIWVIGDSITFGWGVERNETYTQVVADQLGTPTYNIAAPSADVCGYQALVRRMPSAVKPRAAIVGLVLENDLLKYESCAPSESPTQPAAPPAQINLSVGELKLFLTEHLALYNFWAVALKRISVVNETLIRLGLVEREHAFRLHLPPDELDDRIQGTTRALQRLRGMMPTAATFTVLIVPARFEIRDDNAFFRSVRERMVQALQDAGIDVVDPFLRFRQQGFAGTHLAHDGHWSPAGHRLAGEELSVRLRGTGTTPAAPAK